MPPLTAVIVFTAVIFSLAILAANLLRECRISKPVPAEQLFAVGPPGRTLPIGMARFIY